MEEKASDIFELELADLAKEVNGNIVLSFGDAEVKVTLEQLTAYKEAGISTTFPIIFGAALMMSGYSEDEITEFYAEQNALGGGPQIALEAIDENTPLNLTRKEDNPLVNMIVEAFVRQIV